MVAHGHVMVATHVDYLRRIVEDRTEDDQLKKCEDFHLIEKHLREIGANEDCVRFFTRTDEAYRPTYELIRQGRMPESESMLGKLLNRWLGPEDEGLLREQQIDGSKMPEFEKVRHYFGPAGLFADSEDDGWFISGCLLEKRAGDMAAARPRSNCPSAAFTRSMERNVVVFPGPPPVRTNGSV